MYRRLARSLQVPAQLRRAAPLSRGYTSRAPRIFAKDLAAMAVPLARQVQEIVHPSQHTQLKKTRAVAQSTAGGDQDLGHALATEAQRQHAETHARLQRLYTETQAGGAQLTRDEYTAFLEGFNETRDMHSSVSVLRDMRAGGAQPGAAQYSMVLKLAADSGYAPAVYEVGEEMRAAGVADEPRNLDAFYNSLLRSLARSGQIEHAYAVYAEMRERKVAAQGVGCAGLVAGLAQIGEIALALDVLRAALAQGTAFGADTYAALLHGAGRCMHHEGYALGYEQLTRVFGMQLPEGDYLAGLDVAARAGDVALAGDIVQRVRAHGLPLDEKHFEPLLAAVVATGQWARAFRVLNMMRGSGFGTTPATLRVVTRQLTVAADVAERAADEAFAALQENQPELAAAADSVTLDAMVAGLARSGCVEAAAGRLDSWYAALGALRTASSYAAVLEGCVHRRNKTVAEQLLARLLDVDALAPSQRVYDAMVRVTLVQPNYEDAFVYLEAMKAHGMVPPWRTMAAMVRRCARVRDVRAQTLLREMRKLGLVVTPALADYAQAFGRNARSEPQGDSSDPATIGDLLGNDAFSV
ncbi:hypothetical protein IWW54_006028 [Coemansia sp. RSA 2705]|nr:hypothetical protein IWW54_006028 [Coemansia sp. RSA 2705]